LVTGANGFIGSAVVAELDRRRFTVVASSRRPTPLPGGVQNRLVDALSASTDWRAALTGCDSVVHCAARVHVGRERGPDVIAAYRRANVEGSVALGEQAARAGVRRLVFVSSIKVNGEETAPGRPFTTRSPAAPTDPYGVSKAEAEARLLELNARGDLEVVVVRPPLVYGPGVKANFLRMSTLLAKGIPLPLGAVTENRRSLIALDNLVDLLIECVSHPAAMGQVFLAADGEDLSTTVLLQRTARALGVRALLLPVSPALLRWAATAVGRADVWRKLCGSLQVDPSHAVERLGWHPPISVDEGLARTVAGLSVRRKSG
jgi:nucleoside-diphosphate-sugar epimerase